MKKMLISVFAATVFAAIYTQAQDAAAGAAPDNAAQRAQMMSPELRAAREDLQQHDKALKDAVSEDPEIKALDEQLVQLREQMMKLQRRRMEVAKKAADNKPILKEKRDKAREKYFEMAMLARNKATKEAAAKK